MAKPKLTLFTLQNLHELGDGDLKKDFEAALQALVQDCTARPSITKVRKQELVMQITPVVNADGTCDDVMVDVQVATKAPAKRIQPYRMRTTVNGGLRYNADSPNNPDQSTMFGESE